MGFSSVVLTLRPSAQARRCSWLMPQGFCARSMPRKADWSCEGNSPSIMTWLRRMSMMSSICSFWVGQTSMQAPQVVQAQAASGERANLRSGLGLGVPFSKGAGVKAKGLCCAARSLSSMRLLISSAAGERDLPVAVAGQTSWQRLHWMQA